MANRFSKYLLVAIFALSSLFGRADNYPAPANPPQLVNDFASLLSTGQKGALEQTLRAFRDTTTVEIAVVTMNSLGGADIAMYATELAHKWGVGDKNNDSGVLILVKPKSQGERGEVFIAVGYGLEGAIPDAIASQIVHSVMIPSFSQGDMYGGINSAAKLIMGLSSGEYSAVDVEKGINGEGSPASIFIMLFFAIMFISSILKRKDNRSHTYNGTDATTHVPPIFFGIPMSGGYRRGSSDGFGGFGGGSSFGGFGGGGFGGGGAGGSW